MDNTARKATVTGARALLDALLREGIEHVFGIPGRQNLAIVDVLIDQSTLARVVYRP